MGLLQNGYRHNLIGRLFGATALDGANPSVHVYGKHRTAAQRNQFAGEGITDTKASVPSGNRPPSAWIMARKNGAMSSRNAALITGGAAAQGWMGLPTQGTTSFAVTVADATGKLLASGVGTSTFSVTTDTSTLTASIRGIGTSSFTMTGAAALGAEASASASTSFTFSTGASILPTNDASPLRDGTATMIVTVAPSAMLPTNDDSPLRTASAAMSFSGTLNPYAIGIMVGSTADTSVLTVDSIARATWSALAAQNDDTGTMGAKLNMASAGGVDLDALAEAVWSKVLP